MAKITKVRKRDGRIVNFGKDKITNAIFKAVQAVGGSDKTIAESLANQVMEILEKNMPPGAIPNIEDIQDIVERVLIESGHAKTAKAYILYRNEHARVREEQKRILGGKTTKLPFSMNALQVLAKRYLVRNRDGNVIESPDDMFERVADSLASVEYEYGKTNEEVEKFSQQFNEIMASFEFIPAGRTMTNAGSPTPIVPNCIVLHIGDNMDNIFQTLKEASLLQQAGSGLGFPFHLLRPAGTVAKRSRGVASGPVSFLRVYNNAFGVIKQQNRHGANMGVMRVDHPDILEFIHAKDVEGEIRNFNISVAITDEFMQKARDNDSTPWICEWNGEKMKPRRVYRDSNGIVLDIKEETMTAKEIFMEIVSSAWQTGEPGIIFIDKINDTNPLPGLGRIEACNPCVTGDTLVSTEHGMMKISDLAEKHGKGGVSVICDNRMPITIYESDGTKVLIYKGTKGTQINNVSAAWKSGFKDVLKIETESGYELEATADHKIMTTKGWIDVENLTKEHEILIQSGEGRFSVNNQIPFEVQNEFIGENGRTYKYNFPRQWNRELGQLLGWIVGDGWIRDKEKECDKEIMTHIKSIGNMIYGSEKREIERIRNTHHLNYGSRRFVEYLMKLGLKTTGAENKEVPKSIFTAPKDAVSGFLQGLFSSDGTVMLDEKHGNYYIRLTTKSIKLAKQVQTLLLNFGIKSRIYDRSRPPKKNLFTYETKSGEKRTYASDGILFEVHVHGDTIIKFNEQIGFLCSKNKEKIEKILKKNLRDDKFTDKVKYVEYIGKKDVYDLTEPATHSFIANGIVVSNCGEQFLHDGDVCNLGSINLEKFVKDGKIDFDRLRHVTRLAVRMLDNVVDITAAPADRVNHMFRANRRVGLGIMGFADMLYQLKIGYNAEEGAKTAEKVMNCIQESAHQMSQELAEEKGVFPNWEKSVFAKKGIKMRNAALTNIAPTGTISMVFDVSGGVEPYFALAYHYQGILGGATQLYYVNKHLRKTLEEYGLYNDVIMKRIFEEGTLQRIEEIPDDLKRVFVTAMDISSDDHIRVQAAFQKYVDNSISKTCNFPEDATKEDVFQGYLLAWQLGCKSCTVYRNNSRRLQVLNLNKQKQEEVQEEEYEPQQQKIAVAATNGSTHYTTCPECDTVLEQKEGCSSCPQCGWGLCSV